MNNESIGDLLKEDWLNRNTSPAQVTAPASVTVHRGKHNFTILVSLYLAANEQFVPDAVISPEYLPACFALLEMSGDDAIVK